MFSYSELIRGYNVCQYGHIDFLGALIDPRNLFAELNVFDNLEEDKLDECIHEVTKLFKRSGWEGDGEIKIIWLPPFVGTKDTEDTWGTFLWHVKQSIMESHLLLLEITYRLKGYHKKYI
jgi:hypothetical protein